MALAVLLLFSFVIVPFYLCVIRVIPTSGQITLKSSPNSGFDMQITQEKCRFKRIAC